MVLCALMANAQTPIAYPYVFTRQSDCLNIINTDYNPDSIEVFKVRTSDRISFDYFVDLEPGKGWEHNCVYYSFPVLRREGTNLIPAKRYVTKPDNGKQLMSISTHATNDTINANVPTANLTPDQTNSAGNLYAVILSGGGNAASNYVRYWNDCSFIYKTLRNRFGVPASNISLLISDGDDPADDMRLGNGSTMSSPLDLDGDGTNENVLAATKSNLTNTLNNLASTLTTDDRLFLYVIDHGGRDNGHSYINLWNYETIYDQELSTLLNNINVSSMNIVLGQCFSGGFISYLQAPNRVISTACGADEYSYAMSGLNYDEFVHHWTTAVSEHTVYGDRVASDANNNGFVSTSEAFAYANTHDSQPETPQFNAYDSTLGTILALNDSPFTHDLYIRDNVEDTGVEPNTTTEEFWNSPDIWMRNHSDGQYGHEAIQVFSSDQDLYTYVNITNRGEKDYNGRGLYLHLYWAAASTGLTINNWTGEINDYYVSGCPLPAKLIKDTIRAGETKTMMVRWPIPEEIADSVLLTGAPFHICHLAWITSDNSFQAPIPYDPESPWLAGVLNYKTIAQVNASFVATNNGTANMPLIVSNVADEGREYSIEVIPCENNPTDIKNMEIGIQLEEPLFKIWKNGGEMAEKAISYKASPRKFNIQQYHGKISNLQLPKDQRQRLRMNCTCCIVANEDITKETTYEYDIVQRDLSTGKIVGGEHFTIVQQPRKAIWPEIKSTLTQEGYELEAVNVDEDATYTWLNDQGAVLAEGKSAKIVPQIGDKQIKLRVAAKSDGAINYATLTLDQHMNIKGITPNPFKNKLIITLSEPASEDTKVIIAPVNTVGATEEYQIKAGEKEIVVYTSSYKSGIYLVSLLVKGSVIDSRNVVCQQ